MSSNQENNNPTIAGAIAYPANNAMQPLPQQPRQPRNLQGLLRFAMEATKAEDAPGNSELGPMDEERKKFLEEALKSLTIDVAEVLKNAIKVLSDKTKMMSLKQGEPLPDDVATAFSNLLEYIDDMDIANDFYKMGGFAIFPVCYSSDSDEARAQASWVLAELCQNNASCQARALDCGLLQVLLSLLHTEQGTALTKCIYAISCICREFCPGLSVLVAGGGCAGLRAALVGPARAKAAFLLRYLCTHRPDAKEIFIQENLVEAVVNQIKLRHDDTTEHLLDILLLLTEDNDPRVLAQCRDPQLGFLRVLKDCLSYQDEQKSSMTLMKRVFAGLPKKQPVEYEHVDR